MAGSKHCALPAVGHRAQGNRALHGEELREGVVWLCKCALWPFNTRVCASVLCDVSACAAVQILPSKENLLAEFQEEVAGKEEPQLRRLINESEEIAGQRWVMCLHVWSRTRVWVVVGRASRSASNNSLRCQSLYPVFYFFNVSSTFDVWRAGKASRNGWRVFHGIAASGEDGAPKAQHMLTKQGNGLACAKLPGIPVVV
eukprot:740151-Pelagomonas_calceolata.AAC.5